MDHLASLFSFITTLLNSNNVRNSMMPLSSAANDVSLLTLRNDADRCAIHDAMFANHVPQARIIAAGNIMYEAHIICRQGKHHSKKRLLSADKRRFFHGAGGGGRTRTLSPGLDFESSTSANSITPAQITIKL